jgi:hypothetical protein
VNDPAEKKVLTANRADVVRRMRGELDHWQESVKKSLRGEDYRQPGKER